MPPKNKGTKLTLGEFTAAQGEVRIGPTLPTGPDPTRDPNDTGRGRSYYRDDYDAGRNSYDDRGGGGEWGRGDDRGPMPGDRAMESSQWRRMGGGGYGGGSKGFDNWGGSGGYDNRGGPRSGYGGFERGRDGGRDCPPGDRRSSGGMGGGGGAGPIPTERKKLQLQERTLPPPTLPEAVHVQQKEKSRVHEQLAKTEQQPTNPPKGRKANPFGDATAVDTSKREAEIEQKIKEVTIRGLPPAIHNTGGGDAIPTSSENVGENVAQADKGDTDGATDVGDATDEGGSVGPSSAATIEVENEEEVQQAATAKPNSQYTTTQSNHHHSSPNTPPSCTAAMMTTTTGSSEVVSAEKTSKSVRLAGLRESGTHGGEFLSGNDRHGGRKQLPPSTNAFSKRFPRGSRYDRFDGGRPDERRNMAFGGGDRRHEPHGSYRQGYGSGMNDFDDRGCSRGRMDNRGGGFSPAHGGGGRGNGWEGGGGRSTYHDEPLYNHQGNDQRGGHMYRKEDRRAPENERRHRLDIPPPSRNSLATEASNNNPTPSRAYVPSPEPETNKPTVDDIPNREKVTEAAPSQQEDDTQVEDSSDAVVATPERQDEPKPEPTQFVMVQERDPREVDIKKSNEAISSGKLGEDLVRHVMALEENVRPSAFGMTYEILSACENPFDGTWLDESRYKPVLQALSSTSMPDQLQILYAAQLAASDAGFPKNSQGKDSLIQMLFTLLFVNDVVEYDAFMEWKDDIVDKTPGKQKAVTQTITFFAYLDNLGDEESDEEEEEED